ncbi:CDP-glycerol glycerophosphotransferase family protein [Haloglycomyces albus]|uniref:CDP-glycerol glycerophosphotransferase family protein n=1 Tax=Haloglycomyces albus TaxID=526067 RepID=UPI0004B9DE23|nr:CDP-glycerol glycerophosphotransferase family protein [Haloglycomyces albus]
MKAQLRRLVRLGVSLGAVVAVAFALVVPHSYIGLVLALGVLGFVWYRCRRNIAAYMSTRLLSLSAVAVQVWRLEPDRILLVAVFLCIAFVALSGYVRRALNIGYLEADNLDVRRSQSGRWVSRRRITKMGNSVLVLVTVAAFVPDGRWQGAIDLFVSAITILVVSFAFYQGLIGLWRRRNDPHPVDYEVVEAVERLRPRFIIHFAGTPGSQYQLKMWLPYFDAIPDPFLIVVREPYLFNAIARETDRPIVFAPAQSILDRLMLDSVRACFYCNHAIKNTQVVKNGDRMHIQLMHGDSDKAISRSAVSLMYDRVFVAGQGGVDRYHRHGVDIPHYKFRIIGRPQLHAVDTDDRRSRDGGESSRPTVLYAPTWAGLNSEADYSSLAQAHRIVAALLRRNANVVFRSHPYTKANPNYSRAVAQVQRILADDQDKSDRIHRFGAAAEIDMGLIDCINAADVAITDISGTASDWLYSGRPFAMTDPRGFGADYVDEFPISRASYLLRSDLSNIDEVLDELMHYDTKAEERQRMRAYYLSDVPPEMLIDRFVEACRETYEEPVVKRAWVAESGV